MRGSSTALTAPDRLAEASDGRRVRSFRAARRHSSVVRLLKFAIPIGSVLTIAVVALGSVFNPFSRLPGLTVGPISVSGSKIAMETPRLTGFRKDKRPYEVTATTAYQDIRKPNVIELKEMKARLANDDAGAATYLVSKLGIFDSGKDLLDLTGDIRVWSDKGEEILLRSAAVDMKAGTVVSREPVKVTTATLVLEADTLDLSDNGKVIAFTGRVRAKFLRGLEATPAGSATNAAAPSQAAASQAANSQASPSQASPSQALPSQALPSQALPSQALPSQALPSMALPSMASAVEAPAPAAAPGPAAATLPPARPSLPAHASPAAARAESGRPSAKISQAEAGKRP